MALQLSLNLSRRLLKFPRLPSASRPFCAAEPKKPNPKLVNFSLPSDSESDSETPQQPTKKPENLPPPYNPFSKNSAGQKPRADPTNLQEVFAGIRSTDGLMDYAAKMFDGLSQQGLTHEALEMFSKIKDSSQFPDVIVHTAVIEAYVDAKKPKEAHKTYLRMLSGGVLPNAYTYGVVLRGLCESGDPKMVREVRKCVEEMAKRRIKVGADVCVSIVEGYVSVGLGDEGKEILEMVRDKGLGPYEDKVKEALKGKSIAVYRIVMDAFFGK